MPRFRLLDETGRDLGPFLTAAPIWEEGDVIPRGSNVDLVVVRLVEPELEDDFDGYLVVKAAAS